MPLLRIGTRKSPLALAQAEEARARLASAWPGLAVDIVPMVTSGDRFLDQPLSQIGGKGLFTKEIEEALLDGRIDIAVHSMKDMPTVLPEGLTMGAMLPREDVRDMLVVARDGLKSLRDLHKGSVFGTSSLRRAAQIKMLMPDIQLVPMRGNVQTRIRKVEQGEATATMLAVAGLKRLGLQPHGVIVPIEECLPAVGQGAIGLECRAGDARALGVLAAVNHAPTTQAVVCERAFLRVLDGSCRTPIAGHAQVENGQIAFRGLIAKPDGSAHHRIALSGASRDAEALGNEAGQALLGKAGRGFF